MQIDNMGFQKPEIVQVAEQLYGYKSKKKDLEFQLMNEEFMQKYVPKRKQRVRRENATKLLVIIPLVIVTVSACYYIYDYIFRMMSGAEITKVDSVMLLVVMLYLGFGGIALIRLMISYLRNSLVMTNTAINPVAKFLCKILNIKNIKEDERINDDNMFVLRQQIEELTNKISFMERQYKETLKKVQEEEKAKNEEKKVEKREDGKFSLRLDARGSMDLRELFDMYEREEKLCRSALYDINTEIKLLDKRRAKIDEDFDRAKNFIMICLIPFIVFVVVQSMMFDTISKTTGVLCFCGGMLYYFWIESKCVKPFIDYWVEHEYHVVKNYVFYNSIVPLFAQRELIVEKRQQCEKELQDIINKKSALDGDVPKNS